MLSAQAVTATGDVAAEAGPHATGKLVISLGARRRGRRPTWRRAYPEGADIARIMPNTPVQIGPGGVIIWGTASRHRAPSGWARELLASLGEVAVVPEE